MAKSAEQLFAVLGELKGGAMKFGQALSVFEAAVPEEYAAPFRESLVKLQTAAPPMSTGDVQWVLAEQFGRGWRSRFREFDEVPSAAAASIGQVHRAVWRDGREVAVKVQYPGADEALRSDLRQLSRMSRVMQPLVPGLEIKPLIAELRDRMEEELDYRDEADGQRAFAAAFDADERVAVPEVVASAPRALVTEWVTGRKLSDVIRAWNPGRAERRGGAAGRVPLLLAGPGRAAARGSAPRQLPAARRRSADGDGLRRGGPAAGRTAPAAHRDDPAGAADRPAELLQLLRNEGFVLPGSRLRDADAMAYLAPFTEPLRTETFRFNRRWLQRQAERVGDLRGPQFNTGRELNLPPQYLLVHRVTMGTLGVLCQLDADVPLRGIVQHWEPSIFDAGGRDRLSRGPLPVRRWPARFGRWIPGRTGRGSTGRPTRPAAVHCATGLRAAPSRDRGGDVAASQVRRAVGRTRDRSPVGTVGGSGGQGLGVGAVPSQVGLARATARPLARDDHPALEDLAAPDPPRLGPAQGTGQALDADRAAGAQGLGPLQLRGSVGEPQVGVAGATRQVQPGAGCRVEQGAQLGGGAIELLGTDRSAVQRSRSD